jgi:hypothetical protein
LYGYSEPKQWKSINQQLYYYEDHELDLEEIVNDPLPPIPLETTYTGS